MTKSVFTLILAAIMILGMLTGCQYAVQDPVEGVPAASDPQHQDQGAVSASSRIKHQEEQSSTVPVTTEPVAPPAVEPQKLTKEQVKAIAFGHAKVNAADARDLEIELETEKGVTFYEISFDAKGWEYEYSIEAFTGEILFHEAEAPKEVPPAVTEPAAPPATEPAAPVVTEPVVTEPIVTEPVVTEPVVTEPVAPPAAEPQKLSKDEAKAIALGHAKVNAADVRDLEVELETEKGVTFYEISFDAKGWEYDYIIEAFTGEILFHEAEAPKEVPPATEPAAPPATEPAPEAQKLSKDEVKAIAFGHANVAAADVRDLEIELETEKGVTFYEISFDAKGWEYEYTIEAFTGEILFHEAEPPEGAPAATEPAPEAQKLSKDEVKAIVFSHANVAAADVRDLDIELETEKGVTAYEISFEANGREYEYIIEAFTGEILKSHSEQDD